MSVTRRLASRAPRGRTAASAKLDIDGLEDHRLLSVLVEIAGIEPATSGLQSRRSPS